MQRTATALAQIIGLTGFAYGQQAEQVEIGRLECEIEGGIGIVVGSSKDAVCNFYDSDSTEPAEVYFGRVNEFGLDAGVTEQSIIQWQVLAAGSDAWSEGALAGKYTGVSAQDGAGGNVLVGGSDDSFILHPVSIQGQTGLNIATGVTGFQLRPAP